MTYPRLREGTVGVPKLPALLEHGDEEGLMSYVGVQALGSTSRRAMPGMGTASLS